MKITIPLESDSFNTYPPNITFVDDDDSIEIVLTDTDRTVQVSKEQLRKVFKALLEE